MFYKTSFVLLVGLVVATTGRAQTFLTGSETVNQAAFGGGSGSTPFITRAVGTSLGGYEFANDITNAAVTVGDTINIVQVDNFTQYNSSTGGATKNNSPNFITLVSAVQAKVLSTAGTGSVTIITSGQLGLFVTSTLTVTAPHTWGATNLAGTTFTPPSALYSVNTSPPPGGVQPGLAANGLPGQGDTIPQALVNVQSVNLVLATLSQGNVLFKEVSNGGYLVVDPIASTTVGQLALVQEQFQVVNPVLSAADQAALNTIFTNLDPGNGPFATGFGAGPVTNFNPGTGGADADLSSNINLDPVSLTQTTLGVPEPATLSLWGLLLSSGGIGGVIRRYRSKWARKA